MSVYEVPNFENPPCAYTDPEIFFASELPGVSVVEDYRQARKICFQCPYREPCAEYALHNRVKGVWGGLSDKERDIIRKLRNITPRHLDLGTILISRATPKSKQKMKKARERNK
jgi:hypothetical protein